jgi:polyisoprenoid-binding protein YceI
MKLLAFALSVAFLLPTFAHAEKRDVDAHHSSITFTAKHFLVSKIPGRFKAFDGNLNIEKDFTHSQVEFNVDVASIDTAVEKRDEHLRTPDFFDTANFPKATFRSTKILKDGDFYIMTGDLTIRGTTKEVAFKVKDLGVAMDPMYKAERSFFHATTEINRKDFGVSYGDNAIVSDLIELEINLETLPSPAL